MLRFILAFVFAFLGLVDSKIEMKDLGYKYDQDTFFFWEYQMFNKAKGKDPDTDGWHIAYVMNMGEHGGTHMDAPFHMDENGWSVDEIPLDRLLNLPLVVVDVTDKVKHERNYEYTVDDFKNWEADNNQEIPVGSVVLVKSGWSKHYPDRVKFTGMEIDKTTNATSYHFPGFHKDAATFLAETRGIYGVGTESASLDHATLRNFPAHVNFFKKNVWGIENVGNMDGVPVTGARISVLPLKTRRGSGGPSRVIVTWNTDTNDVTKLTSQCTILVATLSLLYRLF